MLARGGGEISIVRSGTFPVSALAPDPARLAGLVTVSAAGGGSATLAGDGGIGLDLAARAVVRGVALRGFSTGIAVRSGGSLLLENSALEGCTEIGIHVADGGSTLVRDVSVIATGTGAAQPRASVGVCFEARAAGQLRRTAIWESQGTGLIKRAANVRLFQVDPHRNFRNVGR